MNRWPTSEHFYAAQDDFRRYIRDEVNPARVKAGLSEIRDDEARECFRIIDQFLDRWMGTASQPSAAPCSKCGGYGNDGDAPCQHCGQTGLEPERVADNGPDQPAAIPCPHPDVAIIDGDLCACCGQRVADNGGAG